MRVRFYIERRRGADGALLVKRRPIFMTVAFNGEKVLISTGKFVDLNMWDQDRQQVNEVNPEAGVINEWLKMLHDTASDVWKSLASLSEKPGAVQFRREFARLRPRFSGGFFEMLIMFMEKGRERWSDSSYRKVRSFYNRLKEFSVATGYQVRYDTINNEFLVEFRNYFSELGLSQVTIHKMINTLVWYLNWASDRGYNIYRDYKKFYKALGKQRLVSVKNSVYLYWDELMQIYNYSTVSPRKERVLDLFCLMCFTGIRFTELIMLEKDDVTDDTIFVHKRSGKKREVPVNNYAKSILLKYKNRFYKDNKALPPVSTVTFNKYLGIIGEELGFSREIPDAVNNQMKRPLYELLKSGVGVQTFILNALRLDVPVGVIHAFTGVRNDHRIEQITREIAKNEIKKFNEL